MNENNQRYQLDEKKTKNEIKLWLGGATDDSAKNNNINLFVFASHLYSKRINKFT
jgi:hypothetical protein